MCNGALAHFTVVNRQWLIVSIRLGTQALHDFWLHLLFDLKEVKRPLSGTNKSHFLQFHSYFTILGTIFSKRNLIRNRSILTNTTIQHTVHRKLQIATVKSTFYKHPTSTRTHQVCHNMNRRYTILRWQMNHQQRRKRIMFITVKSRI